MTRHTTSVTASIRHPNSSASWFDMRAPRASRSISACGWSRMRCQPQTSASDKVVPWSGLDLINAFNTRKKTDTAGRTFAVDTDGVVEIRVTGWALRTEVCQQVFEEAGV